MDETRKKQEARRKKEEGTQGEALDNGSAISMINGR